MRGIIVAGGLGSRLAPLTSVFSKHLLPVYDKPMIYYPISVLMLAKIKDILIISTARDIPFYEQVLGNGNQFGISLSYRIQDSPGGIPEALIIGEGFIGVESVCLALGDNLFFGHDFSSVLARGANLVSGAMIVGYGVKNPDRFGVVELDEDNNVLSLEEKPRCPKSSIAVTGLYFYDNECVKIAKSLKPSKRGELEITDVNLSYMKEGKLKCEVLGRGFAWLDTGTHESLLQAGQFVQIMEERTGTKIACLEEIGLSNGWLDIKSLRENIKNSPKSNYFNYIEELINEN